MVQEEYEYLHFAGPQRMDRDFHLLEGLLTGIAIDGSVNLKEIEALDSWCETHSIVSHLSPFNELIPLIKEAIEDGVLDEEEQADIFWLCNRLSTKNKYYDSVTSDMQRLHGILVGIAADQMITKDELLGLSTWLDAHSHLKGNWPYDDIDKLIASFLKDGKIEKQEHRVLLGFCNEFVGNVPDILLETPISNDFLRHGVCAPSPDISFKDRIFCFTGRSKRTKRKEFADIVKGLGGYFTNTVGKSLDNLIIGGEGSEHEGKKEVVLPDGTHCDRVTATHAVEVDVCIDEHGGVKR